MIEHDFSKNRKIYVYKIVGETKKAVKFSLKSQIIKKFKVKFGTEIWIPFMCYKDCNLNSKDWITVDEWFWNRLIFI